MQRRTVPRCAGMNRSAPTGPRGGGAAAVGAPATSTSSRALNAASRSPSDTSRTSPTCECVHECVHARLVRQQRRVPRARYAFSVSPTDACSGSCRFSFSHGARLRKICVGFSADLVRQRRHVRRILLDALHQARQRLAAERILVRLQCSARWSAMPQCTATSIESVAQKVHTDCGAHIDVGGRRALSQYSLVPFGPSHASPFHGERTAARAFSCSARSCASSSAWSALSRAICRCVSVSASFAASCCAVCSLALRSRTCA